MVGSMRIMVVDDGDNFRNGFSNLLKTRTQEGFEVVGEAKTSEEAIILATTLPHRPHVITMDLEIPENKKSAKVVSSAGIEAIKRIREACPDIRILVITVHDENVFIAGAIKAGALGYLLKGSDQDEIMRAIVAVYNGDFFMGREVTPRFRTMLEGVLKKNALADIFSDCNLSPRELEVLGLLAKNRTNQQIERELTLSDGAVRNYVTEVVSKLREVDPKISNRQEAGDFYNIRLDQYGWNNNSL